MNNSGGLSVTNLIRNSNEEKINKEQPKKSLRKTIFSSGPKSSPMSSPKPNHNTPNLNSAPSSTSTPNSGRGGPPLTPNSSGGHGRKSVFNQSHHPNPHQSPHYKSQRRQTHNMNLAHHNNHSASALGNSLQLR